ELDLGDAPVERLADTLDYDGVARIVRELAAGPHIALIETFAERAAVACLADPRVLSVVVRVEKPGAIPDAAAAACEVAYSRGGRLRGAAPPAIIPCCQAGPRAQHVR